MQRSIYECLGFLCLLALLSCASILSAGQGRLQVAREREGISAEEFLQFARAINKAPGTIYKIVFLRDAQGDYPGRIAVLLRIPEGWTIQVYKSTSDGSFVLEWDSGHLDRPFAVGSVDDFRVDSVPGAQDGDSISFQGCAPHLCRDVVGFIVYVPSLKNSYSAVCVQNHLAFSPLKIDNAKLRSYLEERIAAMRQNRCR